MVDLTFAASLPAAAGEAWRAAIEHPFVEAVARGQLPNERFHVWLRQDYLFVQGLREFVRGLLAPAPEEDRRGLEAGLAALEPELQMFHDYAASEGVDLLAVPLQPCSDYLKFLRDCGGRGYAPGLTAYYGCERAYLEAWTGVLDPAALDSPYRDWIENWTSTPFRAYVEWLSGRLDAIAIGLGRDARDELTAVFRGTVRHEVAFWDACWAGR